MRARALAMCLRDGHIWAAHAPVCVLCAAARDGHDPATIENVVAQLEQALGPWPPG